MKKAIITILALVLLVSMFCATAMASHGDITVKTTKLYADSAMKAYVGTIPAYTALVVRSNDSYTDVYINGQVFYTSGSTLLNKSKLGDFVATLDKDAKVYQRATTDSNSYTLKKKGIVQICKVKGDWALVQTLGERGLYAFVQINQLKNITRI